MKAVCVVNYLFRLKGIWANLKICHSVSSFVFVLAVSLKEKPDSHLDPSYELITLPLERGLYLALIIYVNTVL